jgi:hypothetical protein
VNLQKSFCPHLELVFSIPFVVGVDYFCQFAVSELAVNPFHLLWTDQDAMPMKFSFFELANVLIAVAKVLLAKSLQLRTLIVASLDTLEI